MALSFDFQNRVVTIPQTDCTFVSGTFYKLDTNWFRNQLMAELADEDHIWVEDIFRHNTEVTVAGTTYARSIEIINGWMVEFSPNSQWSVQLEGSNNNIWSVQDGVLAQNQVQVIPTNAAGLIVGEGVDTQRLQDIHAAHFNRRTRNPSTGDEVIYESDKVTPRHQFTTADDGTQITEIDPL